MVKLTIVGRVSDGLPLAHGPRYVNDEENDDNFSSYKQQGEFILKEISRGDLPPSKMTIQVDHHCFNYMVENGICFMMLCDSSYPRKLAFHYLQDLQSEFENFDMSLIERVSRPYSLIKFDGIIGNVRRHYVDTRTQANLSKLYANRGQHLSIASEELSHIVERRRRSEMLERMAEAHQNVSPLWSSKRLEIIALKWTPVTVLLFVTIVLLWASLNLKDELLMTNF